jgi:hypothetical protein
LITNSLVLALALAPPLLLLLAPVPVCGGLLPGLLGKSRSDRRDTAVV